MNLRFLTIENFRHNPDNATIHLTTGLTMSDLNTYQAYSELAEALSTSATREQLLECARLLALNVGYYRATYGELDPAYLDKLAKAESVDDKTAKMLALGMEALAGILGNIVTRQEGEAGVMH